jgi:hypothetical protein
MIVDGLSDLKEAQLLAKTLTAIAKSLIFFICRNFTEIIAMQGFGHLWRFHQAERRSEEFQLGISQKTLFTLRF